MSSPKPLIYDILDSRRTVFTIQSIMMMNRDVNPDVLPLLLHRYVKKGLLLNPRKGVYAKNNYNPEEMACSIFKPAYISLEYVLQKHGVIFQFDSTVTCVSYLSRTIQIENSNYSFRRINQSVWTNMDGISQIDNICIASPERAFLDLMYLTDGNYYFDNLRPINIKTVKKLLGHYNSKSLCQKVVKTLHYR